MKEIKKATVYQTSAGKPYLVEEPGICCDEKYTMSNAEKVYDFVSEARIPNLCQETVYAIFCDIRSRPLSYTELSKGTVGLASIPIRELIQCALLSTAAACAVILVHNHPSGNVNPSQQDIESTKKMKEALELVDLHLVDHVIVSPTAYYSMQEHQIVF